MNPRGILLAPILVLFSTCHFIGFFFVSMFDSRYGSTNHAAAKVGLDFHASICASSILEQADDEIQSGYLMLINHLLHLTLAYLSRSILPTTSCATSWFNLQQCRPYLISHKSTSILVVTNLCQPTYLPTYLPAACALPSRIMSIGSHGRSLRTDAAIVLFAHTTLDLVYFSEVSSRKQ